MKPVNSIEKLKELIKNGNSLEKIKELIDNDNIDISNAKYGFSEENLLIVACIYQRTDIMEYLSKYIDINSTDKFKKTPLMLACELDKSKSFDWLINHGAKIDIQDPFGKTAKDYANGSYSETIQKYFSL